MILSLVKSTSPELDGIEFISEIKSAAKNTGDNAYIYLPIASKNDYLKGTIPVGENSFKISGAMNDPAKETSYLFAKYLSLKNPNYRYLFDSISDPYYMENNLSRMGKPNVIYTHYSPSLDSIIYWFLQKSINLYGEALIKTFAYEKKGFGSTDSGVGIVKDFWKQKGIDEDELNISDGSGFRHKTVLLLMRRWRY